MEKKTRLNLVGKLIAVFSLLLLTACSSSLVIKNVDFAQPIETVLKPNSRGIVNDVKAGLKFSIMPLQYAETKDTSSVTVPDIRLIRGHDGYYYITAKGFKDVFVMQPSNGTLKLHKKVMISKEGLSSPAFNQRTPYVQLINGNSASYNLTKDGLKGKDQ